MKALVTGGTGFIGSNIVQELLRQGYALVITGHDAEQRLKNFPGKILQPSLVGIDWNAIGKVDVIFHQAAINDTTLMDKEEMFRANVESSKHLFEFAKEHGCKRIVYASSTAVYGNVSAPYKEDGPVNPLNPYGESKLALDNFAKEFMKNNPSMVIVGLRYCNVYGPGESHKGHRRSMILQLAQQMRKGNPTLFKHGEQKRDFVYVKDVVAANLLAAKATESCIINCGSGRATSFNDIVAILNNVLATSRKPEYIDNPYKEFYQNFTECDMTKAKEKIGFVPEYSIEQGIKDYFESGMLE